MINFLKMAAMMNQVRTPLFLLVDYLFLPASAAGAEPPKKKRKGNHVSNELKLLFVDTHRSLSHNPHTQPIDHFENYLPGKFSKLTTLKTIVMDSLFRELTG